MKKREAPGQKEPSMGKTSSGSGKKWWKLPINLLMEVFITYGNMVFQQEKSIEEIMVECPEYSPREKFQWKKSAIFEDALPGAKRSGQANFLAKFFQRKTRSEGTAPTRTKSPIMEYSGPHPQASRIPPPKKEEGGSTWDPRPIAKVLFGPSANRTVKKKVEPSDGFIPEIKVTPEEAPAQAPQAPSPFKRANTAKSGAKPAHRELQHKMERYVENLRNDLVRFARNFKQIQARYRAYNRESMAAYIDMKIKGRTYTLRIQAQSNFPSSPPSVVFVDPDTLSPETARWPAANHIYPGQFICISRSLESWQRDPYMRNKGWVPWESSLCDILFEMEIGIRF